MLKEGKYYKWVLVGLLWVVALLNYLDRQMISTMRPSMAVDIHELQSAANFGYLMAIFLWIYGFVSPFSGMIADRINRKWLIISSLFVWSAVTFSMGHATSFQQLYWLRGIMGLSEALYIPASLSLIADFHSTKTRSLAVGIHMTGFYVGQAMGGFGATIASMFSWYQTFMSFGLTGMTHAIVLALFLKEIRRSDSQPVTSSEPLHKGREPLFRGLAILFSNISFWVILFYFAIPSLPGWGIKNWLPTFFSNTLHIEMSLAGPLSTVTIAFSSFLGVVVGGILSDKWVQKNIRGRIYTSAIGLGLTIPALLLISFSHTLFSVVASAFCFGFGFGMFDANNMPILCQFVPERYRATAYGLMNMTGVFAGAFITDLLGKSTDAGNLGETFGLLAIAVSVALVIQLYFLGYRAKKFIQL